MHRVPTRTIRSRHLLPRQQLRPIRQEPNVHRTMLRLPLSPRHLFDLHATTRTLHPARRVIQKHRDVPQRHELVTPRLEPIVARTFLSTPRTDRPSILSGAHLDDDPLAVVLEMRRLVAKRLAWLHVIEDSL